MFNTRVKEFIVNLIIISFILIFSSSIIFNIYDKNDFFKSADNYLYNIFHKSDIGKINDNDNYFVLNFKERIESEIFFYMLSFLIECNPHSIILDLNSDFLKDELYLNQIEILTNKKNNIFGVILTDNKKGILLNNFNYSSDKNFDNNLLNLPDINKNFLFFSNYKNEIGPLNLFKISANKIGFINDKTGYSDSNNIDFIYKFNDKYLMSLPFIIDFYKKKYEIDDLILKYYKLSIGNENYYYDQKGRISFLHNLKNGNYSNIDSLEIDKAVQNRIKIIDIISDLNLTNNDLTGEGHYINENQIINEIYSYEELKDENKNDKLDEAKKLAANWNGYKKASSEKLNNSTIFISGNKTNWIDNFILQKRIISLNINLFRIPLEIILLILFLVFIILIIFLLNRNIKFIIGASITAALIILNFPLFFLLRTFFKIDYPLVSVIFTLIMALITGSILKLINMKLWMHDLRLIFKDSISKPHALKIIDLLRGNKWSLDQKEYLCTIMNVDLSDIFNIKINEDYVDLITKLNNGMNNLIKESNGIIHDISNSKKIVFFGNPIVSKNHAFDAAQCARDIFININPTFMDKNNIIIAVHSDKEWFKLVRSEFGKNYKFIGHSENILLGLQKYAKKFNVKIIITDSVYKLCNYNLPVRMLDKVRIAELKKTYRLFELLTEEQFIAKEQLINFFHAGLKLFENKKWSEASKYFKQCQKIDENDIVTKIYIERCKEYAYVEPLDDWDGVFEIDL